MPSSCSSITSSSSIKLPIRLISTVTHGFKRGSTELGIPTANLSPSPAFDTLPTGIYYGFARIVCSSSSSSSSPNITYKTALSIGYNPHYNNSVKTVEPHLIAPPSDPRRHDSSCGETILGDFYGDLIRLSVVGFIREERGFDGLDELIAAIKNDIAQAERLCECSNNEGVDDDRDVVLLRREREWVGSDDGV